MESIRRGFSTAQRHDSREGEARLEQYIHQLTYVANIREQVCVQTQGAMEGKQMVVRKTSPDIHQVQHQSHGTMFRTHSNIAVGHTTFKFLRSKSQNPLRTPVYLSITCDIVEKCLRSLRAEKGIDKFFFHYAVS